MYDYSVVKHGVVVSVMSDVRTFACCCMLWLQRDSERSVGNVGRLYATGIVSMFYLGRRWTTRHSSFTGALLLSQCAAALYARAPPPTDCSPLFTDFFDVIVAHRRLGRQRQSQENCVRIYFIWTVELRLELNLDVRTENLDAEVILARTLQQGRPTVDVKIGVGLKCILRLKQIGLVMANSHLRRRRRRDWTVELTGFDLSLVGVVGVNWPLSAQLDVFFLRKSYYTYS